MYNFCALVRATMMNLWDTKSSLCCHSVILLLNLFCATLNPSVYYFSHDSIFTCGGVDFSYNHF